jgi:uncharacterized protein YjbJ (UPF0337 family)
MPSANRNILAGMWKQVAGKAKEKWARLTQDEILKTEGRAEQLAGLVQERYGKTQAQARAEVDAFLEDCGC